MSIVFITGLKHLELLHPRGIFSHIRRLGLFFWFKILNINILGGFQRNCFLWGMKILLIFFGVITKVGMFEGHLYAF